MMLILNSSKTYHKKHPKNTFAIHQTLVLSRFIRKLIFITRILSETNPIFLVVEYPHSFHRSTCSNRYFDLYSFFHFISPIRRLEVLRHWPRSDHTRRFSTHLAFLRQTSVSFSTRNTKEWHSRWNLSPRKCNPTRTKKKKKNPPQEIDALSRENGYMHLLVDYLLFYDTIITYEQHIVAKSL